MEHQAQVVASLQVMRDQLLDRLSEFSTTDWRKLFTDLGMTVHVEEDGNAICHFSLPHRQVVEKTAGIVSSTPWSPTGQGWCNYSPGGLRTPELGNKLKDR